MTSDGYFVKKMIKVHRLIMEKMAVRSLADLVRIAERLGVSPAGAPVPSRSATEKAAS